MLPVFSVGDEEEAHKLLVMACPTNQQGEFIDRFTAREQTLDNLELFSNELERFHDILVEHVDCRCKEE